MDYADFSITIGPPKGNRYPVAISSPAGQCRGVLDLPLDEANLEPRLRELVRSLLRAVGMGRHLKMDGTSPGAGSDPLRLGEELFEALFTGAVRDLYQQSVGLVRAQGKGLRIRLHLDPASREVAWLSRLPWELMRPAGQGEAPGPDRMSPIVRYLHVDRPDQPVPLEGVLRLLVVAACPGDLVPLDVEREIQGLKANLDPIEGVEVRVLEDATPQALRDALLDGRPHVVHFMGHGTLSETGEGALLLQGADGFSEALSGSVLARLLQVPQPPALIVLNACESARSGTAPELQPFGSVAEALVREGLLAVVAMQFPISDGAALAFSETLFRRLAKGDPVDAAVAEGRLAIHLRAPGSLEWATPALFLRTPEGRIVDLPFQVPPRISEEIKDFSSYIQEKTKGFVGRQFVFDAVQRFTDDFPRGYLLVRGDPGIGKTSLLAELARREGHVHHFNIRLRNIARTEEFLRNVCAQLIAKYRLPHAFLPPDADRSSLFLLDLLARAARMRPGRKLLVLVDALDEADPVGLSPGSNLLCLPETLPQGVYFIATARNVDEVDLPLRIDCENDTLVLDHDSPENRADVEAFVREQLAVVGVQRYLAAQKLAAEDFVRELSERSEGNFMYLRCVLWEIERDPEWSRSLDQIPRGLKEYYEDHWRRMRSVDERLWREAKLPVILALTVTRKPIPLERIALYAQVDDPRLILSVLRDWKPFLHEEGEAIEARRYQLYHASFFDFLKKKDEVEGGHLFQGAHGRVRQAMSERLASRRKGK